MNPDRIIEAVRRNIDGLRRYIDTQAPRIVGTIAVNHIREDFAAGGFTNGGRTPWKPTKRQQSGGTNAASQYGPLTSSRNRLMNSVTYLTGKRKVTVKTDVEYAAVHNFGGTVHPRVTPRMRRFAWAMYYELGGEVPTGKAKRKGKKYRLPSPEAEMWKRLALTKKERLTIHIPQRRFMPSADTPELDRKIQQRLEKDIIKILDN